MKLKALTMLGLIVFAALIGTAFAATHDGCTRDQTQRSEIKEHVRKHMGTFGNEVVERNGGTHGQPLE